MMAIVANMSYQALSCFSQTCRASYEDANRILWRSIVMPPEEQIDLLMEACAAICRDPKRARHIKGMKYSATVREGCPLNPSFCSYTPDINRRMLDTLTEALNFMPNLVEISLHPSVYFASYSLSKLRLAIRSKRARLNLKSLAIACVVFGIESLLSSQDSIECLRIAIPSTIIPSQWPHDALFLPALKSIQADYATIVDVVPGRPVQHVHVLGPFDFNKVPAFVQALAKSTRDVLHLGFEFEVRAAGHVIPYILDALPDITCLSIPRHTVTRWNGGLERREASVDGGSMWEAVAMPASAYVPGIRFGQCDTFLSHEEARWCLVRLDCSATRGHRVVKVLYIHS
ncbi:hypothetical protein BS47DRAFT_1489259 [Hydnum rufescens UP504]|uniref:Uncharacterized protein n=1 Tax=Hydnum rufescens UP504 TaxID=1448309 RepID=A0A9P6AJV7_9AGAM|nr:hypothetical protein BS47DRAFT_1489259 [Hydnum rufescens UP504]